MVWLLVKTYLLVKSGRVPITDLLLKDELGTINKMEFLQDVEEQKHF